MPGELVPLKLDPILSVETLAVQELGGRVDYFTDGREGVDRWGRQRKNLKACGQGWDSYVCPAYAEEACPGDNRGNRSMALRVHVCDMLCGACGGGGRVDTMAYCGYSKGAELFAGLYVEFGGTLRLDRHTTEAPVAPLTPYGVPYIPAVEWGAKDWMPSLHSAWGREFPVLATSVRTATPGNRKTPTPLSDRLGDYGGRVIVHGLTKDDVLDDKWEVRGRLMEWCLDQGVDTMITPQYSYYDEDQNCVGLDTEILTERGWLRHDQVQVGDRTLGYNEDTGRSEWTAITHVHHTTDQLYLHGNAQWWARSTSAHRWVTPRGTMPIADMNARDKLLLAAPTDHDGGSDLSPTEAAILAWVDCDGNVSSKGEVTIAQSKPSGLLALRTLLADVPHQERPPRPNGVVVFALRRSWYQSVADRAGEDREALVLSLSPAARTAWLQAVVEAEGYDRANSGTRIVQRDWPLIDAIALAIYLEGDRPAVRLQSRWWKGHRNHNVYEVRRSRRATVGAYSLRTRRLGVQPVWCVTTELGSWTMRQDRQVSLTGNCMALGNVNRSFRWYTECRELGFPNVALDWPPWALPWLYDEYIDFALRNDVKLVAPSYQTLGTSGSLDAHFAKQLMDMHKALPSDVAFLVFGTGSPTVVATICKLLAGREISFVTTDAYAKAIWFKLSTDTKAPPGWTKADAFAWNVIYNAKRFSKLTGQPLPRDLATEMPSPASAGTRRAARARPKRRAR